MKIQGDNVHFFKVNPQNPEESKINGCDFIFIDGFSIRKDTLKHVLTNIISSAYSNSTVVVLNVKGVNQVENEEAVKIMSDAWKGKVQIEDDRKIIYNSVCERCSSEEN